MWGGFMSESILIRGGRVVDPAQMLDGVHDVLLRDGKVAAIDPEDGAACADRVLDASDKIVTPGLIDVHVHFRDPGFTEKETLETGARSAAVAGFTTVCCMPNTNPALDTPDRVRDIVNRSKDLPTRIHPIGAVSIARAGTELADLRGMAEAGAIGFSDDGDSTKSSLVMRRALEITRELNLPIMVHCEDWTLIDGGAINEGPISDELGLPGLTAACEEIIINRDIELARLTGGWLHVLHVTTRRGRDLVREAVREGYRVTAEVMPHHLVMTEDWVAGRRKFVGGSELALGPCPDPNAKVNPPLRTEKDARALLEGVLDGTFEVLATDHAPHASDDKPEDLRKAASGMIGLEVAIPSLLHLVQLGELPLTTMVERLTTSPARIFGLDGGSLKPGMVADVTIIDPENEWVVDEPSIASKSKNTPLLGMTLQGRATTTILGGEIVHEV
jgi:dihydroorotase